jgi:hypothetical protein
MQNRACLYRNLGYFSARSERRIDDSADLKWNLYSNGLGGVTIFWRIA